METKRYILSRHMENHDTKWGPVRVKIAQGFGVRKEKAEYEDLARIARTQDISLEEARAQAHASLGEIKK